MKNEQISDGDTVMHSNSGRRGIVQGRRTRPDGRIEYEVLCDLELKSWSSRWVRKVAPDVKPASESRQLRAGILAIIADDDMTSGAVRRTLQELLDRVPSQETDGE